MLIFDRISANPTPNLGEGLSLSLSTEPPTEVTVSPAVMDAYCVLSDLCLLTARSGGSGLLSWGGGDKEKPKLLTLSNLQRTFGLELIESILSGYEEPVKQVSSHCLLESNSLMVATGTSSPPEPFTRCSTAQIAGRETDIPNRPPGMPTYLPPHPIVFGTAPRSGRKLPIYPDQARNGRKRR